ncbi:hypothetical protein BpHYR1_030824 [Brachionus plicatilis]|uniref:Uncharacterized protein n=1 Tax=Brachionus plicatilis TaxID=10195 RepID=A0A3M7R9T6_BRAPC|nr:hypothetical protein BpHYR1_030824 [Brachionus plicatilis]
MDFFGWSRSVICVWYFVLYGLCDIATSLSISLERSINTCSNTSNEGDRIDGPKGTNVNITD